MEFVEFLDASCEFIKILDKYKQVKFRNAWLALTARSQLKV